MLTPIQRILQGKKPFKKPKPFQFDSDGLAVRGKALGALDDPAFRAAYDWSVHFEHGGVRSHWIDVDLRWRAHICTWAVKQGLLLEGDFVECGVDTAMIAGTVIKYLGWEKTGRDFFLFDTYEGIPDVPGMNEDEKRWRKKLNATSYADSWSFIQAKFSAYPNVKLVRGYLPDTLTAVAGRKIAYLSVDLNNAPSEEAVIRHLWPQLQPGAIIILDDYAFDAHEAQYKFWNDFARSHGVMVATCPTGQGILIKPTR